VIKIFIFWYLGIICFKIPNISPEQIFDIPLQEREPVKMTVDPFSHTAANYNLLNYTMSFLVIMLCTCGGFHMCCYVTRLTWRVSLVEQELLTLPEHLSSPPVFSEVRDTRYVLYVCFVDHCLSFCTFFFWPLCCLFFFDIRILITSLVSSNSSYGILQLILFHLPQAWLTLVNFNNPV